MDTGVVVAGVVEFDSVAFMLSVVELRSIVLFCEVTVTLTILVVTLSIGVLVVVVVELLISVVFVSFG